MTTTESTQLDFSDLSLSETVLKAIKDCGYETPTPIQEKTIPLMMEGKDVLGQAQTGTGKTAAFAMPLLSKIDLKQTQPQVLVLTPTRELAIQVAEAFQRYAGRMRGFHVLPIYGGQDYEIQLRQLRRGVHVVVGTPGRVMDHMRRGTLKLDNLKCLVLDEGDEMLRMGFIDDVEWVLEQAPAERQMALFSATMPKTIQRIAQKYLHDPVVVSIKVHTSSPETINQRYWMVSGYHKLDALTRILEGEPFDGMIVFVRTKTATDELAEKLEARGYSTAALNGDVPQKRRENTIAGLKAGKFDILVATDVAARGLDVERISHVVNYDIPYDPEAYIHRVGRTGRAGRTGEAILFVAPRERHMLRAIEIATKQKITMMELPSVDIINNKRISNFMERITNTLAVEESGFYYQLLEQYRQEHNVPALEIAAALAKMFQGDKPLLLKDNPVPIRPSKPLKSSRSSKSERGDKFHGKRGATKKDKVLGPVDAGKERYRIEVGYAHGVKPNHIVGAMANEGGIDSKYIGRIEIFNDFSVVDLPDDMPRETIRPLKKIWVSGQQMKISKFKEGDKPKSGEKPKTSKTRSRFIPKDKKSSSARPRKKKSSS